MDRHPLPCRINCQEFCCPDVVTAQDPATHARTLARPLDCQRHETDRFVAWWVGQPVIADGSFASVIASLKESSGDPSSLMSALPDIDGQFSLVLLDKLNGHRYLVSDRLGMEPLYYAKCRDDVRWSFRIRGLVDFLPHRELDEGGLDEMLLYRWLMEDHTMLKGVRRVLPGECICLRRDGNVVAHRYSKVEYRPSPNAGEMSSIVDATEQALDGYFARLRGRHSSIAVMLSGGVDSSLLLAIATKHRFETLIAITCRFVGHENPELQRAADVAGHLGVEHVIVDLTDDFIAQCIPWLTWQCESPVSYFNLVAREAMLRSLEGKVSAVVVGEGADGMFSMEVGSGGSALQFHAKQRYVGMMPRVLRQIGARVLSRSRRPIARRAARLLAMNTLEFIRNQGVLFKPGAGTSGIGAEELIPALREIRKKHRRQFYVRYEPDGFEASGFDESMVIRFTQNRGLFTQNRHQYFCYMALAAPRRLHVSMPFLSKEVMAIGLHLPTQLRSDERGAKPVLKKLACRYVPEPIVYAHKMGFETPLEAWLENKSSYWRSILNDERTRSRGLLRADVVSQLDARRDALLIWTAFALELFLRQFVDDDGQPPMTGGDEQSRLDGTRPIPHAA